MSCNYFFYEVGRLTGIKTLDDYATQFGLGQYTGIEIGGPNSAEAKGALASRSTPRPTIWSGPTVRP
ncbi:MAG: penicillin-binding transpeptidase domain-containing protein [Vescimonas sp.]